jgi:hypothetical protein
MSSDCLCCHSNRPLNTKYVYWVTGYWHEVVSYKAPHATAIIFWYIVFPIWILSITDSYITFICSGCSRDTSSKAGRNWERNSSWILPISVSYFKGFLTWRKILRNGVDSFTSPLKEIMLWISVALKNRRCRPGLNLRTLEKRQAR